MISVVFVTLFILGQKIRPANSRPPANAACKLASRQTLQFIAAADTASTRTRFSVANSLLDTASKVLGNSYSQDNLEDDTDQHWMLAQIFEERGELKRAAFLKRRILVERLGICGVRTNPPAAASLLR